MHPVYGLLSVAGNFVREPGGGEPQLRIRGEHMRCNLFGRTGHSVMLRWPDPLGEADVIVLGHCFLLLLELIASFKAFRKCSCPALPCQ